MVDCRWANADTTAIHGANVSLGRKFALASGLLEITYDTGANVILQGPVRYEVNSRDGGFLSVGKLTARLDNAKLHAANQKSSLSTAHAPLFTIESPSATITDLGTEFGVEVGKDGVTDTQVFVGAIQVTSLHNDNSTKTKQVVRAGNAVRVNGTGDRLTAIQPTARQFVRKLQSNSPAYRNAVLADKPYFYWNFDESDGPAFEQVRHTGSQALLAKGKASRCTHAVIGSGLALGRAADFTKATGCFTSGRMDQGEMPGAWAIEFWLQAAGDRRKQAGSI